MKKYMSIIAVGVTLVSSMANAQSYNNTVRLKSFVPPVVVQEQLEVLRAELGEEKIQQILGPGTLQSLDTYSTLDPDGINANFVAAAAGGAAACVVEYVWDRYVGNGPKKRVVNEQYFDLNPDRAPNSLRDPDAATPAAVGMAAGAAVAYKAVEYSMRTVFGSPNSVPQYSDTSFDIHPTN